ncbi:MAG: toll/interleukin-1 receptor domain-containing protein [Caldilineaceae bacterium]|nr:toll/interleukin-1 receptor domain-containing protein [Caldilineaceae bacterium]
MSAVRAFVSYSWDDEEHKDWVAILATELRNDGVETVLDQWHTAPGDQLTEFMETQIRENSFVLVICTPNYRQRSDERMGGVGYEGNIMTAEVLNQGNHRKFIPILAQATWENAAPSWLRGKYYLDFSSPNKLKKNYPDLITTLRGERQSAPPVRGSLQTSSELQSIRSEQSPQGDPLKIVGIIVDEVTEPTMDGTQGSALYTVPFRLSKEPSSLWSEIFVKLWDFPPRFTTMHRPGIARVVGSKIILDGTTIEEIEKYHKETLTLCVKGANEEEAMAIERIRQDEERKRQRAAQHRVTVEKIASELDFD